MDSKKKIQSRQKRATFPHHKRKNKIFMSNMVPASVRPRSSNNIKEIELFHQQTKGKDTLKEQSYNAAQMTTTKKSRVFAKKVVNAQPDFVKGTVERLAVLQRPLVAYLAIFQLGCLIHIHTWVFFSCTKPKNTARMIKKILIKIFWPFKECSRNSTMQHINTVYLFLSRIIYF